MIDASWTTSILVVLNLFLGLACYFYSHRKAFSDEYSPKNGQVLGVLVEDFYEGVSKWVSQRKKKGKNDELDELMGSLADLFAKSKKLSKWNSHINKGKDFLKSGSANMVLAGVLSAATLFSLGALLDSDPSLALILGFVFGYSGILCLARGIGQWRSLCAIESKIDEYHSSLTLGRSMVVNDEEDEQNEV